MNTKTIKFLLFLIAITVLIFSSCENKCDIQTNINVLKKRQHQEYEVLSNVMSIIEQKQIISSRLDAEIQEKKIYASGKTPKYILKLHLKQSHLSLSITTHLRDAANAIDFEMPVDSSFYNSIKTGTDIVDNFRAGSFIFHGSFGSWKMTVTGKEIRE